MALKSILVAAALLIGLGEASDASDNAAPWQVLEVERLAPDLEGVWRSAPTGHLVEFTASGYSVFHEVGAFCLPDTGQLPALRLYQMNPTRSQAQLFFYDYRAHPALLQNPLRVDRIDALPAHCGRQADLESSPVQTFDAVWALFDRHYAFFRRARCGLVRGPGSVPAPG